MKKKYAEVIKRIDFSKSENGLVPAIVQDSSTNVVLMLGFMNSEALQETIDSGLVTFIAAASNGYG